MPPGLHSTTNNSAGAILSLEITSSMTGALSTKTWGMELDMLICEQHFDRA
jgi:hypothetical protein